jgi:N-acetyl-anhydromuramyl-L-alanine amidase AmpD
MEVKVEDLNIKWYPAPDKEYHKDIFDKKQIVIHHTASGGNSKGDMDYLNTDSQGAVNVPLFVDRDGTCWQAFSTKYYAAHLGVPSSTFQKFKVNNDSLNLHKHSIAIELDSWGYLSLKDGKYYSWEGSEVKPENVITYPEGYLGQKYYEKYYAEQLAKLKLILLYLGKTYNVNLEYKSNMWGVSADALSGKEGLWTHTSYRETGKWDCHPQPELIEMLKSLKNN